MTEYAGIRGTRIKYLSSDPTLNTSTEGQVWYNSTSNTLKLLSSTGTWVSSGSMIDARRLGGGAGTQNSLFVAGGPVPASAEAYEYNGTGWSEIPSINTARYGLGGAGTTSAGLIWGGWVPPSQTVTEEYNGSSWSEQEDLNTATYAAANCGTQTAGLTNGGIPSGSGPSRTNKTEEYNGASWATVNASSTSTSSGALAGIQTAAIRAFGELPARTAASELYDGTNWTTGPTGSTARSGLGASGATQTAAVFYGGSTPPVSAVTESFDGTSFSTQGNMGTAREGIPSGPTGTSIAATAAGGESATAVVTNTEEYAFSINTRTAAAWSSGGNLNTGRSNLGATGPKTAGLAIQGETSTDVNNVEEYNGSSWANATAHPESKQSASVAGLQTAAISLGGYPLVTTSVSYDGTNWTSSPALTVANANWAAGGPSTACFGIGGGEVPGAPNSGKYHDQYDGSSWTSATNMSTTRVQCAALGAAQNAILATGGRANTPGAPSTRISSTESWNGSSWTAGPSMQQARSGHLAFGTQTAGIIQAGSTNPGSTTLTSQNGYDGTAFSTGPNNSVNHGGLGGIGGTTAPVAASVSNCFMCGGPGSNQATEEFSEETAEAAAKTLTTS